MKLASISDYRTLFTTDDTSATLISADYGLNHDEVLILELTNDNRITVHKARIAATDPEAFTPLFQSWLGAPCNWRG